MKCSKCGAEVPEDSKFCIHCGNNLEDQRKLQAILDAGGWTCPGCGMVLPAGTNFCTHCGTAKPAPAPEPAAEEPVSGWKCPNCGSQMTDDSKFCTSCGTKRPEEPVSDVGDAPVEQANEEPTAETTAEEPVEEVVAEPVEEAVEKTLEEPVEEPVEETAEEQVEDVAEEPAEEQVGENTEEPAAETAAVPTEEPTDEAPAAEPAAEAPIDGWKCPNCGSTMPDTTKFCTSCGTRKPDAQPQTPPPTMVIKDPAPQPAPVPPAAPQQTFVENKEPKQINDSWKTVLITVLVVILVALVAFLVWAGVTGKLGNLGIGKKTPDSSVSTNNNNETPTQEIDPKQFQGELDSLATQNAEGTSGWHNGNLMGTAEIVKREWIDNNYIVVLQVDVDTEYRDNNYDVDYSETCLDHYYTYNVFPNVKADGKGSYTKGTTLKPSTKLYIFYSFDEQHGHYVFGFDNPDEALSKAENRL